MAHVEKFELGSELAASSFVERASTDRAQRNAYVSGKRVFDVAAVLLASIVAIPLIALLVLLVRRDGSPGLFSQPRVGRDGRVFRFWKLRTMVPDAEARLQRHLESDPAAKAEWDEMQKLSNDPRITPIGRFLRKTSLDELPQLWNVLMGDMSLVGPRPMLPEQRAFYPGTAYYALRPGLTGFWQVSDRNNCSFAGRAAHDTAYAYSMSFWVDLKVLRQTVSVVLHGTGV